MRCEVSACDTESEQSGWTDDTWSQVSKCLHAYHSSSPATQQKGQPSAARATQPWLIDITRPAGRQREQWAVTETNIHGCYDADGRTTSKFSWRAASQVVFPHVYVVGFRCCLSVPGIVCMHFCVCAWVWVFGSAPSAAKQALSRCLHAFSGAKEQTYTNSWSHMS